MPIEPEASEKSKQDGLYSELLSISHHSQQLDTVRRSSISMKPPIWLQDYVMTNHKGSTPNPIYNFVNIHTYLHLIQVLLMLLPDLKNQPPTRMH